MLVANLYLLILIVLVVLGIALALVMLRRGATVAQRNGEASSFRRRKRDHEQP